MLLLAALPENLGLFAFWILFCAVIDDYDYVFSENGLVAHKDGKLVGSQVLYNLKMRVHAWILQQFSWIYWDIMKEVNWDASGLNLQVGALVLNSLA